MEKIIGKVRRTLARVQYNAPAVLTYALICAAALLLIGWTNGWALRYLFSVYRSSMADPLAYVRIIGHAAGHVSFEHFFGNILIVLMVGPMLEEKYGAKNMAWMIGITALVTGVAQVLFFRTGLTGASGVAFMMILLSSFANAKEGRVPMTLLASLALFLGRELTEVFAADGVSQTTHIIGGLCGASFGFFHNTKNRMGRKGE